MPYPGPVTDRARWIADNQANWDDRAAAHEAAGYGIPERVADPDHIGRIVGQDRERLGALDGLCWLPDLAEWARVVASMLRPGGRFFLREDHPFRATIGEDVSNGLRVEQAYLERAEPATWDEASTYIDTPEDGPAITHTVHHEWNHSLGEVVSALLGAGLVIDGLEEFVTSAWAPWPSIMTKTEAGYALRDRPERLPLEYVLQAHRPG